MQLKNKLLKIQKDIPATYAKEKRAVGFNRMPALLRFSLQELNPNKAHVL